MDLNAPLGLRPPPPSRHRLVLSLVGIVGVVALGGLGLVLALADPQGGRPSVVAAIPPAPPAAKPTPLDPTPTGAIPPMAAKAAPPSKEAGSLEGGVMVYRGGTDRPAAAPAGAPLVIDVSRALDDPLGKARAAGAKPAAQVPGQAAAASAVKPRIAIFVSGMGLDAGATRTAIETMPAAVTLAFLPYGETLAASVGAAKTKGHEVLLQVPMRNDGGSAPGPHALRPDAPAATTKADLAWSMDRFAGYDGIVNLLGAPVTADSATMTAVLKAAGARHLFYVDDGTSRRSIATDLAGDLNVTVVKADLVIDATADPAVVRANLDHLVAIAKRTGHAIGMASGLPDHFGAIARFAGELDGKGVTLVPVAALAQAGVPAGMAAAR